MKISRIEKKLPRKLFEILSGEIEDLRPAQAKAVKGGLLKGKNLLVCTPTASGKTLIAEIAAVKTILEDGGKAVFVLPLKALANEKFRNFRKRYGKTCRIALTMGDMDSADSYLADYDLIITTSEKLDSLLRHHSPWLKSVRTVIIDEIHLLNDPGRGPTLEILITMLRMILIRAQIIGLSATIGNPEVLAAWLDAELILDSWRPVPLHKGVYLNGEVTFEKEIT
ncbi:MAG: DEAD/DEAH box helicase [archaeon]